jgi:hypothetical protein
MNEPKLTFVEVVTSEHGEKFAADWYETDSVEEACAFAEIIEWPEWDNDAQARCLDIQDEIIERVFTELRGTITETFVRVANEVLSRERELE